MYISNDAEQVCFEVRRAASLAEQTDYFGFLSLVGNSSRLSGITNSNLGEIEFGYASGQSPTAPLLIIVKLLFSSETLFFVNNADEGYYFFDDSRKCADFFSECIELFGMIIWVEQPQLLAQLAAL
ncbi:hypothetical protein [Hymenobacter sp.]|uniref:hypothetical protein n=1 Tax=Hymenobacter sp. TaxID=1898978 RepID=UPI00286A7EC3|nr:hypothetical protein [Hymenobacter sp.]